MIKYLRGFCRYSLVKKQNNILENCLFGVGYIHLYAFHRYTCEHCSIPILFYRLLDILILWQKAIKIIITIKAPIILYMYYQKSNAVKFYLVFSYQRILTETSGRDKDINLKGHAMNEVMMCRLMSSTVATDDLRAKSICNIYL